MRTGARSRGWVWGGGLVWVLMILGCVSPDLAGGEFQSVKVQAVVRDPRNGQPVALLTDPHAQRAMPIWIGESEAMALEAALQGTVSKRPMTHDLLSSVISKLRASLEEVRVTELKEEIYYASILLKGPQGMVQVDARPSDAMVLAVKTGRPISVEKSLFEARSVLLPKAALEMYGMEVQELDADLRSVLGYRGEGVLIANVVPNTPAHTAGLRAGDVLATVEGKPVHDPQELEDLFLGARGMIGLEIFREGKRLSLVVPSPLER